MRNSFRGVAGCLLVAFAAGCGGDTTNESSDRVTDVPAVPVVADSGDSPLVAETTESPVPPVRPENDSTPTVPPEAAAPEEKPPETPTVKDAPAEDEPVELSLEELEHLAKIAVDPSASEPREAFAKWLEDAEPERAELIRVQIQLESLERDDPRHSELRRRANAIVAKHRVAWSKPVEPLIGAGNSAYVQSGYINGLECSDVTDGKLACLSAVPTIQEIDIRSGRITEAGAALIAGLQNPKRVSLGEDVELVDGALEAFANLAPWSLFECYCNGVDRAAVKAIGERRMKRFDALAETEKPVAARRYLQAISYRPLPAGPIKIARLSQVGITDAQMHFLAALPDLEEIDISEAYDLTSRGLESLKNHKNLRRLELWDTKVHSLTPIFRHTTLRVLNVYPEHDTEMGDAGTAGLEKLIKLEEMYLSDQGISDATVKRLAPLTKLRKLNLSVGKGIENESSLAALSNLAALESLTLHGVNYGDEGLSYFSNLKSLVTLNTRVKLDKGEGLKHLAGLPRLRYLFLSGDAVTDEGIRHLAPLAGLRSFMAQGSKITPDGAAWLAAKLPGVTIILDEHVVKSPREKYTFKRRTFKEIASVLVPVDWQDDSRRSRNALWAQEDGWEKVGGYSGDKVGPASIHLYVRDAKPNETAEQAVMDVVNNNAHLGPKVLERKVVQFENAPNAASCVYRNSHAQSLVCAGVLGNQMVSFWCEAPANRFEDFRPMFLYVAQSVRLSEDTQSHVAEEVDVTKKDLKRIPADSGLPGRKE